LLDFTLRFSGIDVTDITKPVYEGKQVVTLESTINPGASPIRGRLEQSCQSNLRAGVMEITSYSGLIVDHEEVIFQQEVFVATHQVIPHTRVKIKKIAVLTDLSQNADAALRFAATFARGYKADIVLAHAYIPPSCAYAAPEVKLVHQTLDAFRQRLGTLLLTETEATYLHDIKCTVVLHEGSAKELLAELRDADLIVVGTSGATGIQKAVLGSTAETILHSSAIPVLTVGPYCRRSGAESIALNTILYATDFSPGSAGALPYALSIAREHNAKLVLLHVAHDKDVPFSFERTMASAEPLEKLRNLVPDDIDLKRKPMCVVGFGTPAATIIEEAKKDQADIIVVGARGASAAFSHLGGRTAYHIAAHADCPVLTIRQS
jgi:nucleotide-binding universal stress UspA family protein